MFCPSCPDCHGTGLAVKYQYALPCLLCKANILGNAYMTQADLKNQSYMTSWTIVERSSTYWNWLKRMVVLGHIDPDPKPPSEKAQAECR